MRKWLLSGLAVSLCLVVSAQLHAQEDAKAVVEKAIKAYGGADKLAQHKAFFVKGKGTIEIMGVSVEFTSSSTTSFAGKLKSNVELDVMGQKVPVVQVCDGTKGWLQLGGNTIELDGDLLKEMKEELHNSRVQSLLPLVQDKDITLKSLGEDKVNGKPAMGVKVSAKGFRDIDLYFDKDTGLITKSVRQVRDTTTMQEVGQETVLSDHREMNGLKYATKAVVKRDGKKYLEVEVVEYKSLPKVDDSEFAKP